MLNRVRNFANEARPVTERLIKDLFGTIKGFASTEDELRDVFDDEQRLKIFVQSIAKYNLFLSQLSISGLTCSVNESFGSVDLNQSGVETTSFLETSSKWAIQWFAPKIKSILTFRSEVMPLRDLRSLIQFPFGHLEHLVSRARHPESREDTRI